MSTALIYGINAVSTHSERKHRELSTVVHEDGCTAYQGAARTGSCSDPAASLVIGTAPLPSQLQGVFWLTGQGESSVMMSFGKNNDDDACGYNTGVAVANDGEKNRVIVFGDKNWAFQDPAYTTFELVDHSDLVYEFEFNDDFSHAVIQPVFHNPGPAFSAASLLTSLSALISGDLIFANGVDAPQSVVRFEQTLLTAEQNTQYPNSVVWRRNTYALGNLEIESARYDLVQVLDASGNKLEPAFSDMVASCDTYGPPGNFFYHEKIVPETTDNGCSCRPEWSYGFGTYNNCDADIGSPKWCIVEGTDCGTAFDWWSFTDGNWDYC